MRGHSLISDYVAWNGADSIAKLYQDAMAVLVPTPSLYDIYTYTEDEDVETDMLGPAEIVDVDMDQGTTLSTLFEELIDALATHIAASGVTGGGFADLDAYLGVTTLLGRHYRMARDYANPLRTLDGVGAIAAAGVFPSITTLGSFVHGSTGVSDTPLNLSLEGPARMVARVTAGIGAADWLIDVICIDSGPASDLTIALTADAQTIEVGDATDFPVAGTVQIDDELITITNTGRTGAVICTDATRGVSGTDAAIHAVDSVVRAAVTRTITLGNALGIDSEVQILRLPIMGTARSGQAIVAMTAPETAGFAAGQHVLLKDDDYPRKLTSDLPYIDGYQLYGNQIVVEDTWPYDVGDVIVLHDDTHGDTTLIVYDVDRPNYTITVTTYIAQGYTMAQRAHVRLLTAEGLDRSNNEVAVIDSVDDAGTITLDANLRNTYYTSGYVYLLIAKIAEVSTSSGGQAGDAVVIRALPDRTIYK